MLEVVAAIRQEGEPVKLHTLEKIVSFDFQTSNKFEDPNKIHNFRDLGIVTDDGGDYSLGELFEDEGG